MCETRIYTHVSGKALRGLQRIVRDRELLVSAAPTAQGYTVISRPARGRRAH